MATMTEQMPVVTKKRSVRKSKPRKHTASAKQKLTLEQAEKLALGRPYELIDGMMVFKMGDDKHADAQSLLGAEFVNYFKANPIGIVRTEFTHRLWPDRPHEGRMPDLAIILNENLNKSERYATKAPILPSRSSPAMIPGQTYSTKLSFIWKKAAARSGSSIRTRKPW